MPLRLKPLTSSDAKAWAWLDYISFKGTVGRYLWLRDPSPDTLQLMAQDRLKDLQMEDTYHWKIIDTDLQDPEQPIAFASWTIYPHQREEADIEADNVIPDMYPERNMPAVKEFWAPLFEAHKAVMGARPHMMISMFGTHPDHQRRGAGKMLMEWGCQEADRRGLEIYVEASSMGKGLYEKFGCEKVQGEYTECRFDTRPWGGRDDEVQTVSLWVSFI
jgi:GNAT superfamily N-acetyltransferase